MDKRKSAKSKPEADKAKKPASTKRRPGPKPKVLADYDGPKIDMTEGSYHQVPLDKLNVEDGTFQIRASTRPEPLVESIRSHGILNPLVARSHPDKEGEYQLISGFNRAQAARLAGLSVVPVTVRALSDQEAYIFSYAENENRQSLSDLDRACAIQKLRESGVAKSTADVARLFRISERQVQHIEALLKYPKAIQEAVADGQISATHALVLNQGYQKHKPAFDLAKWIQRTIDEKLSVAGLRDAIKKAHRARAPRKQLLRKRGDTWVFNWKYLDGASEDVRQKAISDLEEMFVRLKG